MQEDPENGLRGKALTTLIGRRGADSGLEIKLKSDLGAIMMETNSITMSVIRNVTMTRKHQRLAVPKQSHTDLDAFDL
jgi:hypothetical protein